MFTLSLEEVRDTHNKLDGNHSEMWLKIGDRVAAMNYADQELPYPGTFLFFEERYLAIIEDLILDGRPINKIVDIGCQLGFQSEWFDGVAYHGMDCYSSNFFNAGKTGVTYHVATFPDTEMKLKDAVVISSMSLGYFNQWVDEDEGIALKRIADKLCECSRLYISTDMKLLNILALRFDTMRYIPTALSSPDFPMYYLEK